MVYGCLVAAALIVGGLGVGIAMPPAADAMLGALPRTRRPATGHLLLGGVSWISSLVYFVGQAIAQAAWKTPYSLVDNAISNLGIATCGTPAAGSQLAARLGWVGYRCSPLHAVMNVSFILTGAFLLLGLYLTRTELPRRRLTTWGLALLALAGLGKTIAVTVSRRSGRSLAPVP